MNISEIFLSIDGEGKRAGLPVIFIRSFGCNINCSYCDSGYACKGDDYEKMTVDEIIDEISQYDCKRITFTGGEPLIQSDADKLLKELSKRGYDVNVETNGTIDTIYFRYDNIWFTVDYKCPSSGEQSSMKEEVFTHLKPEDVVKFVVGSRDDLDAAYDMITSGKINPKCQVFLSPVFGEIEPAEIVDYMMNYHMNDVKIQLQLHKFIWDKDMRGV